MSLLASPYKSINFVKMPKKEIVDIYTNYGMQCTYIRGVKGDAKSFKTPLFPEKDLCTETVDWNGATGIGIKLGGASRVRAIDIDNFQVMIRNDYQDEKSAFPIRRYADEFFLHECLSILGLPEDYEWVVKTPHGYHIIFTAPDCNFDIASYGAPPERRKNRISGNIIHYDRIEILWNHSHLVMPPAILDGYARYDYVNVCIPHYAPMEVSIGNVFDFINYFCGRFEYIHDLLDKTASPLLCDGHFFPHYHLDLTNCSEWMTRDVLEQELDNNIQWLKACKSPSGYNTLGIALLMTELKNNLSFNNAVREASLCFKKADDYWAHYNLACMMALGILHGSIIDFYNHLEKAVGFPKEYKDQLIMLYLSRNTEYEKYAILDTYYYDYKYLQKVSLLIIDRKGHILEEMNKYVENECQETSCIYAPISIEDVLHNINHILKKVDYVVGFNIERQMNMLQNEAANCGIVFDDAMMCPTIDVDLSNEVQEYVFTNVHNIKEKFVKKMELK